MSILDQQRVLVLNGAWVCIGEKTTQQALIDVCCGSHQAIDFTDGYMLPLKWEAWIKLPIRSGDDIIHTSHAAIRAPRVIIATRYRRVPTKDKKCNIKNLLAHYGHECQLTGQKLTKSNASREHVKPQSHGGTDGWHNEVPAHKDVNSKRGNLPYERVGLKRPVVKPAPKAKPFAESVRNTYNLPEWELILGKREKV